MKRLKVQTKLWLFKAVLFGPLLCGNETWVLLAPHLKHLHAFVMGSPWVKLRVSWWHKKWNTELWFLGSLEREWR